MERLMDDHDLAHQIIRSFLDSLPEQIKQLKHDIASGDLRMIQEQTHKLKGAAANLSGESLAALANSIEQAARQNDSGTVSRRAEVLEKEVEALVAALENELTALPARNLAALSFSTAARKE
jgi:HPt (histidine-containing phosphotransfer) domain-containing protein